ncbi:MAG: hypothetical protein ABIR32_04740 [Ilumatobacteraceae bacterium]
MLISRRTLLLGAAATGLVACTSRTELGGESAGPAVAPGLINPFAPSRPSDAVADPTATNPPIEKIPTSVTMVGDSISALSKSALDTVLDGMGFETVMIDAEPSRRIQVGKKNPTNGLAVISFIEGAQPPDVWVIELGTNDAGLYADDKEYQDLIDSVLDVIGKDVQLVWVNTYRDDHIDGCIQFNGLLQATLERRGNATVADWYQLCSAKDATILTKDGVHPNKAGILVMADTVRSAIASRLG